MSEEWAPTPEQAVLLDAARQAQQYRQRTRTLVEDARRALARCRADEAAAIRDRDEALRALMAAGVTAYRAAHEVGVSESLAGKIRQQG